MKVLWLDINSSYAHSSLALPALHAQLDEEIDGKLDWKIISSTVSGSEEYLIEEVLQFSPDLILTTMWLFNCQYVNNLIKKIKRISNQTLVICGGPQFLGDNFEFLNQNPHIDYVFRGDGEEVFSSIIQNLIDKNYEKLCLIKGICFLDRTARYVDNGKCLTESFNLLNFPENSKYFELSKPFVQIETSRGCFNNCVFCVSGIENGVQYSNLNLLSERLNYFYDKGIKEIRILDRTFNANDSYAAQMLEIFKEYEGKLRFHIEIHPALLGEKIKKILKEVQPSLLHIEAGIQSLNDNTIALCKRAGSNSNAISGLKFLANECNLEVHADLIAGLPEYSLMDIIADIRRLSECNVTEIQLELLKLLPGTELRDSAMNSDIIYSTEPPYEVLSTKSIDYSELNLVKRVSEILDNWYNKQNWRSLFKTLVSDYELFPLIFAKYLKDNDIEIHKMNMENKAILFGRYIFDNYYEYFIEYIKVWVKEGFSLKKWPGTLLEERKLFYSQEIPLKEKGERYKYYCFKFNDRQLWFLFNSDINRNKPIKIEEIIINH